MRTPEGVVITDRPIAKLLNTVPCIAAVELVGNRAVKAWIAPPLPRLGGGPGELSVILRVPRGDPFADNPAQALCGGGGGDNLHHHFGRLVNRIGPRRAVLPRTLGI
ncbi:hypothetical protein LV35_04257 [Acinetobacter baumannii]|uniref:Uncharacterized protein n=1 Tax=Acinetobacter baumannii TaxID=470 RepID=A0AAJ0QTF3_ACIBA|nr:hypothetical protein LV35_04257 [Acinetobacter baumannii]